MLAVTLKMRSYFQRGENASRHILIAFYTAAMFAAMWFGQDGAVAIFLVLALDQYRSIELVALRREIRAKKMWHGGEA